MKSIFTKFLYAICALLICVSITACTNESRPKSLMEKILKEDKITVGVKFDARPFGFVDENGELQGFDIDLAKKIAKNIIK